MAGTPNFIQLPSDSDGKKIQTWDNTINSQDVHAEAAVPTDSTGTEKATATNPLRIDPTGTTLQPVDLSSVGGSAVGAYSYSPNPNAGGLVVRPLSYKDVYDSNPASIAANTTLTGAWNDTLNGGATSLVVQWFVPSTGFAENALVIEQTQDQVGIVQAASFTPTAGVPSFGVVPAFLRYWRVKFINGGNAQTSPLFQTTISTTPLTAVSHVHTDSTGITTGLRTPIIFKTATATASGNTAVWTPSSGTAFRLMRFMAQVTGNATITSGAVLTISLQDGSTALNLAFDTFIPGTALSASNDFVSPWVDLGNGVLSAATGNVLNVHLSSTLATGNVRITVCGTEE